MAPSRAPGRTTPSRSSKLACEADAEDRSSIHYRSHRQSRPRHPIVFCRAVAAAFYRCCSATAPPGPSRVGTLRSFRRWPPRECRLLGREQHTARGVFARAQKQRLSSHGGVSSATVSQSESCGRRSLSSRMRRSVVEFSERPPCPHSRRIDHRRPLLARAARRSSSSRRREFEKFWICESRVHAELPLGVGSGRWRSQQRSSSLY